MPVAAVESCPVIIQSLGSSSSLKAGLLAALAQSGSSNYWLIIKYQNASQKPISGIRFTVVYLNSVREPVNTEDVTTSGGILKPGKSFQIIQPDSGQSVVGWVARILFADGTTWDDDGTKSCANGK